MDFLEQLLINDYTCYYFRNNCYIVLGSGTGLSAAVAAFNLKPKYNRCNAATVTTDIIYNRIEQIVVVNNYWYCYGNKNFECSV
jgi:hypothetical protein